VVWWLCVGFCGASEKKGRGVFFKVAPPVCVSPHTPHANGRGKSKRKTKPSLQRCSECRRFPPHPLRRHSLFSLFSRRKKFLKNFSSYLLTNFLNFVILSLSIMALSKKDESKRTVYEKYIRCGKPNCKCNYGFPHGKYLYERYRARNGKIVWRYLGKCQTKNGRSLKKK
jgi:hypothetical protein